MLPSLISLCYALSIKTKNYRKAPKFWDTRSFCCNLPKIQTKRQNFRVFRQKDENGIAISEDPDQTAPLANSEDPDQTSPL